jgi:hypothetical protein
MHFSLRGVVLGQTRDGKTTLERKRNYVSDDLSMSEKLSMFDASACLFHGIIAHVQPAQ